jgi:hypothetical protein
MLGGFGFGLGGRAGKLVSVAPAPDPAFDPATLSLDGWYKASYGGSPWSPTASAGTSGANGTLVTSGVAPGVGAAVNALDPASFDGATTGLVTNTAAMSDMISVGSMTLIVLFKGAVAVAATANFYDDPALVTDGGGGGNVGLVYTSSGIRAGVFQGASNQTNSIALATGVWALCALRFNGSTVKCRVSQAGGTTDATPVASGNPAFGSAMFVGKNYAATKFLQGDILEVMTSKTELSDANLVSIRGYMNSRYALALT